jgi:hypothetical protein
MRYSNYSLVDPVDTALNGNESIDVFYRVCKFAIFQCVDWYSKTPYSQMFT